MPPVSQTAAVRIMQRLHGQRRLGTALANVLVSSPDSQPIVRWVADKRTVGRRHLPAGQMNNRAPCSDYENEQATSREAFAYHVLASLDSKTTCSESRSLSSSPPFHVVVLKTQPSQSTYIPTSTVGDSSVICAPFSLSDLAETTRVRAGISRLHYILKPTAAACNAQQQFLPRLSGDSVKALPSSSRETDVAACCPPHSFDLMVVEVSGDSASPDAVEKGLLMAPHYLTTSGSFLAVFPASVASHLNTHAIKQFTKWRFREAYWAKDRRSGDEDVQYLLCSALAGESTAALVDDAAYPGFLPVGVRRAKHWSLRSASSQRGSGRRHKNPFVASLRPSFTNAKLVRESLQSSLDKEETVKKKMQEDDDAFFAVAYDMVEKGWHNRKPEN